MYDSAALLDGLLKQFTGGYTIVKDYVRGEQVRSREMFVPLTHAPGEAQADWAKRWW